MNNTKDSGVELREAFYSLLVETGEHDRCDPPSYYLEPVGEFLHPLALERIINFFSTQAAPRHPKNPQTHIEGVEASRELFEKHTMKVADKCFMQKDYLARKPNGSYVDKSVYAAWEGWQARESYLNATQPTQEANNFIESKLLPWLEILHSDATRNNETTKRADWYNIINFIKKNYKQPKE